jgi:GntR family transcriptional regulator, transcriptional repressor for pyruvate dehydrogenase complex
MTPPRTGELIAQRIRHRILTGELEQGDEIPTEADLQAEFGVSRPTLRDAMRILETEGLIRVRRGRFGGATVLQPTADRAAYHFGLVLQREGATMEDVARARSVLEPVCAGLCASGPDHEQLAAELEVLVDRCADVVDAGEQPGEFPPACLRVHTAILDACGNTTLRLLMEALESIWTGTEQRLLKTIREVYGYPPRDERLRIVSSLRAVVTDIAAGDAAAAERSMRAMTRISLAYWIDVDAATGDSQAALAIE